MLASMWSTLAVEKARWHFYPHHRRRDKAAKSLGSFYKHVLCRAHVPFPPSELHSEVRTL